MLTAHRRDIASSLFCARARGHTTQHNIFIDVDGCLFCAHLQKLSKVHKWKIPHYVIPTDASSLEAAAKVGSQVQARQLVSEVGSSKFSTCGYIQQIKKKISKLSGSRSSNYDTFQLLSGFSRTKEIYSAANNFRFTPSKQKRNRK